MRRFFTNLAALTLFWLSIVAAQSTQPFTLNASDGVPLDRFGTAVAIDGDFAIVGAPGHTDNGAESGAAYIFRNDVTTWTEIAKLTASDGTTGDEFGFSVAIQGDYAVVGAREKDDVGPHSGAVYVFQRTGNTWTQTTKLMGSLVTWDSHFGYDVAIDVDYVVASATSIDKQHPGLVFIFQRSGNIWREVSNFFTPDIGEGDNFGSGLSISGDYVVIGDENYPAGGASGIAYIFKRAPAGAGWTNEAKLTASDTAPGDQFGLSVSIDSDFVIVSAPSDDDAGESSGSAYIFQRQDTNWVEIAKLTAGDAFTGQLFGWSAAIRGDFAVVGAIGPDNDTPGAAYVFQKNNTTWLEIAKLISPDIGEGDLFGSSVYISNKDLIVGDKNFPAGLATGSAYVYPLAVLPVGIFEDRNESPTTFALHQNYPNPFNPSTNIKYSVPNNGFVKLSVYNLIGEEVNVLVRGQVNAGFYEVTFNATNLPSGIYFYKLQADAIVETKKMVLMK
ncbi:MAG: T9SS type A sorting domain-containing protein [Bacteroidetes bacterium]|nr:T9SS type A sorting domain-containing protein [Bacteroidota bacterium]